MVGFIGSHKCSILHCCLTRIGNNEGVVTSLRAMALDACVDDFCDCVLPVPARLLASLALH